MMSETQWRSSSTCSLSQAWIEKRKGIYEMKTLKARIGRSKFPCLKEIVWSLQWKMDLENPLDNLSVPCIFWTSFPSPRENNNCSKFCLFKPPNRLINKANWQNCSYYLGNFSVIESICINIWFSMVYAGACDLRSFSMYHGNEDQTQL